VHIAILRQIPPTVESECRRVFVRVPRISPPEITPVLTEAVVRGPRTQETRVLSETILFWTSDGKFSPRQVFLRVRPFFPVSVILTMVHTHTSWFYHRRCRNFTTDSVGK
jgi:hypothetical protein